MSESKPDLAIIGGGPGGYLAALRAVQLGLSVVLVEEDRVGGTCINYGCIPAKYLLHQTKMLRELRTWRNLEGPASELRLSWAAAQAGRQAVVDRLVSGLEFLLRKGKAELVKGRARLRPGRRVVIESAQGGREIEAGAVVLAAGSRSADLPFLRADGRDVITSREALELAAPPRSLLVVGAGAIGLEMGSIYQRLGVDVTVLEILPRILPGSDGESATRLERALKKQGLKIFTRMKIEAATVEPGRTALRGTNLVTAKPFAFEAEKILLSAGRRPNSETLADGVPLEIGPGGFVRVDAGLRTSEPGVFAIGDLIGGKLLAHKAYHDAIVAVENASGAAVREADSAALPMAVFTEPEFASVGLTQEEAAAKWPAVRTGVFPLQASGRALTMDATDGLVKVIAGPDGIVVGAHIVAPAASDMIPVLTMAVSRKLRLDDVAGLIYIHPTLSECIGEAALKADGKALHIVNA